MQFLEPQVELFDRDRLYGALGYSLTDQSRMQFGYMHQFTDNMTNGRGYIALALRDRSVIEDATSSVEALSYKVGLVLGQQEIDI